MKQGNFAHGLCSRRSIYAIASVCLLTIGALPVDSANAASAFAAGIPDDVSNQGAAFGASYNYSSREGAETRAMQECQKQTAPASTIALCRIIAHFDNQCVAVSIDPAAGTPGFGWAVGNTADDANSQATEHCHETAGSARASYCQLTLTDCDASSPARK